MGKVIILGAKGRFGRAARSAFAEAGWDVTEFGRNWSDAADPGIQRITGEVEDTAALLQATKGQDVIVNAINPPYQDWVHALPPITASILRAAKHSGATVLIPGNVYNYGADAPVVYSEDTPWRPTTRKGRLRVEMEDAYRAAGVRTIVLRAGDFIEREKSGGWFDLQIAAKAHQGTTVYPGPLDQVHAWAYLPDLGRAAVALAERRDTFAPFEEFTFEGFSLTGAALVEQIRQATGTPQKVRRAPWAMIWILGLFQPLMREVREMRYLWNVPHRMDGRKFKRLFPGFRVTPVEDALRQILAP